MSLEENITCTFPRPFCLNKEPGVKQMKQTCDNKNYLPIDELKKIITGLKNKDSTHTHSASCKHCHCHGFDTAWLTILKDIEDRFDFVTDSITKKSNLIDIEDIESVNMDDIKPIHLQSLFGEIVNVAEKQWNTSLDEKEIEKNDLLDCEIVPKENFAQTILTYFNTLIHSSSFTKISTMLDGMTPEKMQEGMEQLTSLSDNNKTQLVSQLDKVKSLFIFCNYIMNDDKQFVDKTTRCDVITHLSNFKQFLSDLDKNGSQGGKRIIKRKTRKLYRKKTTGRKKKNKKINRKKTRKNYKGGFGALEAFIIIGTVLFIIMVFSGKKKSGAD